MKSFLLFFFITCSVVQAQSFLNLTELDVSRSEQGFQAPTINEAVHGGAIQVQEKTYTNGLGVYAPFQLKIKLNGAHRFKSKIGVLDQSHELNRSEVQAIPLTDGQKLYYAIDSRKKQFLGVGAKGDGIDKGSVIFRIEHKGKEVYNSGLIKQGDPVREIDLVLKGGEVSLIVEDAGDGPSGDSAGWLEAAFEYFEVAPVAIKASAETTREQDEMISRSMNTFISELPVMHDLYQTPGYDWLIDPSKASAGVFRSDDGKDLILSNGLVARVFRLSPNLATVDYVNQMTGESLLRAVSNEGILVIDGKSHALGGLSSQKEYGYTLREWVDELKAVEGSFWVEDVEIAPITNRLEWKRVRWAMNEEMPTGKDLIFTLRKDQIVVKVHYELYNGLPVIGKWFEIVNEGSLPVTLNSFKLEQLAMVEGESLVDTPDHWVKPNIHFETDYAFGSMQQKNSDHTTYWEKDPRYTSQTNYPLNLPCLLEIKPPLGPEKNLGPGERMTSFHLWEMPMDSRDQERSGLFKRKFYRTVSPWTTENPIFLHLTSTDPKVIKTAVDQCAATGYEMIILSFGSGLNMEREGENFYKRFKEHVDYANSKGIELGGYSLLSSRWISEEVDVINPKTGKRGGMIFGSSPCLSSEWGYDYFRKIKKFFEKTGMQVFENDGSYPGNVCASEDHAHHQGLKDSQWEQYAQIQDLYQWMRGRGIYMNVPDFYLNSGTNKTGIGYREVNWSLPRSRQLVLGRMNIYDGLWDRIPSMNWTFVPLTEYHGGGEAATLEPLKEHLSDYENQMMQNYGSGVQACYRGPRLYDAPETKELVVKVIDWYKKYRLILNSDIIHLRRPDGKNWDGFVHVNPDLKQKGMVMLFNPTEKAMERTIELPLYYTGLKEKVLIRIKEGNAKEYQLDRSYATKVRVTIPANSYTWLVIE